VKYLIDTNVFSELKRGKRAHPNVVAWYETMPLDSVCTSVVVLGEIRRGIELIARRDKLQGDALERWYATMRRRLAVRVLDVDEQIMLIWSRISVPDMLHSYDGLIAATALAHDLIMATGNTADYQRAGLRIINPWKDSA
jgi:predicted nucleic acid-binding protein